MIAPDHRTCERARARLSHMFADACVRTRGDSKCSKGPKQGQQHCGCAFRFLSVCPGFFVCFFCLLLLLCSRCFCCCYSSCVRLFLSYNVRLSRNPRAHQPTVDLININCSELFYCNRTTHTHACLLTKQQCALILVVGARARASLHPAPHVTSDLMGILKTMITILRHTHASLVKCGAHH